MADISFLQNEDVDDTNEQEMANSPEVDSTNYGYDQRDANGDTFDDSRGSLHPLHPMERLQQYASCEISYNRQLVGRILVEIFRGAVDNGTELNVAEVMQPVHKLVNDIDATVRLELIEQLPHVAMICQEAPERFGDVLSNHLIHIIVSFHHDADQQVRQSTHTTLLALIERGLLDKDSAEHVVAPTLLMMGAQPAKLAYINLAIDGMSKVAPILSPKTAEKLFLDRYLSLCRDENSFIRKLCAIHYGEFSAAMPKDTMYDKLLPMYINLCKDPVWTVRKSCAEVIVSVACCVTLEHRRTTLSEILASHLEDESKWVRLSAYQILGPFISTFAKRFTGFAYNLYGELVLTDQHGTELKYNIISFVGAVASSVSTKMARDEGYDVEDGLMNESYISDESEAQNDTESNRPSSYDANKENLRVNDASRGDCASNDNSSKIEDPVPDAFNPFLYFYIPPDLPLDPALIESVRGSSESSSSSSSPPSARFDYASDKRRVNRWRCASGRERRSQSKDQLVRDTFNDKNCSEDGEIIWEMKKLWQDHKSTIKKSSQDNGQTIVPQVLVDFFVSMADHEASWDNKWNIAEIPRFCAFYFPAVVLTLGKENWSMLKVAYGYLSEAREYKVRRTMASSIHEIAMILGEELSAQDLLPIYDGFIKDLDEVRIGALKHLATFLKVLKPADRCQFLPRLRVFLRMDNEWNWRYREEVACRLLEAIQLFSIADVSKHIAPLSVPLLVDKVAAVRKMALELVTHIVLYLASDKDLVSAILNELRTMLTADSSRWTCRQTFALLCASLISKEAITGERFGRDLLPSLLAISTDHVPNVRLAVIRTLTTQVLSISNTLSPDHLAKVNQRIKLMRLDRDRDVRALAGGIVGKYQALQSYEYSREQ